MKSYSERKRELLEKMSQENQKYKKSFEASSTKKRELKAKVDIQSSEMDSVFSSKLIRTGGLCKLVNQTFRDSVDEYYGCRVYINGTKVICEVFLEEKQHRDGKTPTGLIKCLKKRTVNNDKNPYSVLASYNNRNKMNRIYELTDEGKDLFSEFVENEYIIDYNNAIINYDKCTKEVIDRNELNMTRVYYRIQISLAKILEKRYGSVNKSGEKLCYNISIVRPLATLTDQSTGNLFTTDWLFTISQLNQNLLNNILAEAGIGGSSSLGIVKA